MPACTQDEEFQTDKFDRRHSPLQVHLCQWLLGPEKACTQYMQCVGGLCTLWRFARDFG